LQSAPHLVEIGHRDLHFGFEIVVRHEQSLFERAM
jgi:hypothetical protein